MAKLPSISSWFPVLFSYRCSEMAFLPMLGTGPSSYFFSLQLGFFFPLPFCWLFSLADLCFDPSYFAFCSSKSLRTSQILCTLFHKIFTKLASKVLSFVVKSCVPSFCFLGILFAVSVFKEVVHPCERRFVDVLWKLIKLVSKTLCLFLRLSYRCCRRISDEFSAQFGNGLFSGYCPINSIEPRCVL
ncbi:hypothetical protein DVH24_019441 [Malus domestica]|uniref:Uncharacterized protein n=1 Tax=Malus domestica TaxID=3750 RepID=A0A498I621_MALDO|nr:hypothetical protein DVH24_019441 [Malus domestica]